VALAAAAAAAEPKETLSCEQVASIGVAAMTDDGVIALRLRSLPPGPIGEGTMRYKPGDQEYEDIKKHIGGIKPGETKPVRPWCREMAVKSPENKPGLRKLVRVERREAPAFLATGTRQDGRR
jgi:hypothetical protein